MKSAYIQFKPALYDIQKNIRKIDGLIEKVKSADLIVLPELASTGYNFKDLDSAKNCAEEIQKSQFVEFLIAKAKQHNSYLVAGFNELLNDDLYNSSVLVGPNGYIGKYQKIHLYFNEKDIFKTGNAGLNVYDIECAKIGMLICYDYLFPEIWRIMALKGAEIIAHSSNLLTTNAQKTIPAQAFMNKYFIITANRIGTEGEFTFNGNSFVTDPNADIIDRASATEEEVRLVEFNPQDSHNKWINERNHALQDRQPNLYKEIIKNSNLD